MVLALPEQPAPECAAAGGGVRDGAGDVEDVRARMDHANAAGGCGPRRDRPARADGRQGDLRRQLPDGGLRQRLANSLLTDASRFTRNLEKAYREMWANWCGGSQGKAR